MAADEVYREAGFEPGYRPGHRPQLRVADPVLAPLADQSGEFPQGNLWYPYANTSHTANWRKSSRIFGRLESILL